MANNKGNGGRSKKPSSAKAGTKKAVKEPIPIDSGMAAPSGAASIHPDHTPLTQDHLGIEEEIRQRAYELYEQRGRQEGFHDEDWARAETEILARRGKKEKSA